MAGHSKWANIKHRKGGPEPVRQPGAAVAGLRRGAVAGAGLAARTGVEGGAGAHPGRR